MSVSSNYTSLALPGLSGYDFSSIVDTMVQNYSLPLNKMQQQQSDLQVKQSAWRDINTRLSALENTLASLRDKPTWSATTATSSNSNVLSVSSASGTVKGAYSVKVLAVATAQTVTSNKVAVDDPAGATGLTAGTFSITVGDKVSQIKVTAGESLQDIAQAINDANAGVSASVVKVSGGYKLALIAKDTGEANAATFADVDDGTVLKDLGVLDSGGNLANIAQAAGDAVLEINGISEITSASNNVTTAIPGLTLNLNSKSDTAVTVSVSSDYSAAETAVQNFVDQYNSLMSFIEDKTSYDADTQTKGDLFGDPVLQGIQSKLRSLLSSTLNISTGTFKTMSQIGITTSSDNYGKSATLEFDTSKFEEALGKDADSVANLFGAAAGGFTPATASTTTQSAQGLANILEEYLHPMVMYQGSIEKTEDNYQKQIDDVKKQIDDFNARIATYTENTKAKFARLETALAGLSSQSSWLTSQISAMTSSND
jgi:flagellar hook-associated protein 2